MRLLVTPDGLEPYVINLQPGDAVVVEPVDPDNRTQAERNAQNALDATRLQRVEAHLKAMRRALTDLPALAKVPAALVLDKVNQAYDAPVA